MRELKIVFTKSKKRFPIGSWLIRWWTGKDYSHVAREVQRQDWGAAYYQASEGKVNYEYKLIFDQKHEIIKEYTLLISPEMEMKIREACWKQCGNIYGFKQNLGIALIDIGILKSNPWKTGVNCSEILYITVFKELYPELEYNQDTIKPHDIEDIILSKCAEICKK